MAEVYKAAMESHTKTLRPHNIRSQRSRQVEDESQREQRREADRRRLRVIRQQESDVCQSQRVANLRQRAAERLALESADAWP